LADYAVARLICPTLPRKGSGFTEL